MVLVVDDDPAVPRLVEGLLLAGGEGALDVAPASTLAEALDAIPVVQPCAILLDLRLPDSEGLDALRRCRAVVEDRVPIVVLTAEGDREIAVRALRDGADDFLLKTELSAHSLARSLRYALERAEHRNALRDMERLSRAVVESIDSQIAIVDASGVIVQVNRAWKDLGERTGAPAFVAGPGISLLDPATTIACCAAQQFIEALRLVLRAERESVEIDLTTSTPHGGELHLRLRICPVVLDGRRGAAIVFDDVTQKVLAEREREAAAARMRAALDAGHIVAWDWAALQDSIACSPAAGRLLGIALPDGRVSIERLRSLCHPDDRADVIETVLRAREDRTSIVHEFRVVRPDGSIRWLEAHGRFLYDDRGRALRMAGAAVDVTERKLASARHVLSQRLEALGELSTGVAHDLGNMLTLGMSAIGRLEELLPDSREARAALDDLRLASEQSRQLAASLLGFARPERDRPQQAIDLNRTCAEFVRFLRRLLPKTLRLAIACGDEPAPILVAPVHVQQVLMNLVLNARNAVAEQGEIRVQVRTEAGQHVLEVSDDGPGIPREVLPRVFEPFYSVASNGTADTCPGTGIGLTIVKTIMDAAGGSVDVESTPGRGTTFVCRWPAHATSTLPIDLAVQPKGGPLHAPGAPLVCVIDRHEYVRRMVADGLSEDGFRVLDAASIDSLFRGVRDEDRTAMRIVVADGESCGGSLRECPASLADAGWRGPALVLANSDLETDGWTSDCIDDGHRANPGPVEVLRKPFTLAQLRSAVRRMLDASHAGASAGRTGRIDVERDGDGHTASTPTRFGRGSLGGGASS
jgi:signal transduction histidine kinase/FixJ family two-component response regulator